MPVTVIAGIDRVVQQVHQRLAVGTMPFQLPSVRPAVGSHRQADAVMHQVTQQPVDTPLAVELIEQQAYHGLRLLVGVEGQPLGHADVANGRMVEQLAATGLVQPPFVHPSPQEVQLGLTHDALQAQQQPVVEVGRVVQAIIVAQQRMEDAAQADQRCPVRVGACQATGLQAQDDADVIEPEFGEDVLEADAANSCLAAASLVAIDEFDPIAGPAQRHGQIGQGILSHGRFFVLGDLLGTGLTDIDDGFTVQMAVADLGGACRHQVGGQANRTGPGRRSAGSGVELRSAHGRPPSAPWVGGSGR
jgi:hypothetical protein